MQCEVKAGDNHKEGTNGHYGIAIKKANAVIMGRKTTDRHSGKTMAYGIKSSHASGPVGQRANNSQAKINFKQHVSCFSNTWGQFGVFHWPGRFSAIDLHAADTEHG